MKNFPPKELLVVAMFIMLGGFAYGGYRYRLAVFELQVVKMNFASSTAEMQNKVKGLQDEKTHLEEANKGLEENLSRAKNDNVGLAEALAGEQNKNNLFEAQIQAIGSTVGTLEKLSKTDKELLQKYSKVYFLNEHYIPPNLTNIATSSLYQTDKPIKIHTKVSPYLLRLLDAATVAGTPLQIISGYRSFGEQAVLKSGYAITYGTGANKFSADQGYSEHQLGTTVDFTTSDLGAAFSKFESASAFTWLTQNAYQYGFVLSYPKKNTYYQFEPWHWRFVGTALASKLHANNQYFYDLDQREIDSYLISIFD